LATDHKTMQKTGHIRLETSDINFVIN